MCVFKPLVVKKSCSVEQVDGRNDAPILDQRQVDDRATSKAGDKVRVSKISLDLVEIVSHIGFPFAYNLVKPIIVIQLDPP